MMTQRSLHWPIFAVFVLAIVGYPLIFASRYAVGAGIGVGLISIATVGYVLLIGYARQLAVGQAAFCMIGGYGNALLVTSAGFDPTLAMLVSMAGAMAVAWVIGLPILRLRGYGLAMASLSFQLMLGFAATQAQSVTGGAAGIFGIPRFSVFGFFLATDAEFFYFVWFCVAVSVAIGITIDRSAIGRALKAIASSERAAAAMGMSNARYKLQMFVLSAGLASVAGSLTVHYLRIMAPDVFGFQYSLNIITAVVAGGLNSIWGGVLGGAIVIGLREGLRLTALPQLEGIIMGGLTVIVLILFPRGVAGGIELLARSLRGRHPMPAQQVVAGPDAAPAACSGPKGGDAVLSVKGAARHFGSLRAVDDVDFAVPAGSVTALIGPNGAGKTTMFDLICGFQPLDGGEIAFERHRIETMHPHLVARRGLGRSFQNLEPFDNLTVLENVMCGTCRRTETGIAATLAHLPHVAAAEHASREEAERCLEFVGLAAFRDHRPGMLSFGQQRLAEIARALALRPTLLLLDEPASGLNDTETEQLAYLILRIRATGITVLLIEHDMRLVMGVADHVVVMNYGKKIAEGPPDAVRSDPQVVAAYIGTR